MTCLLLVWTDSRLLIGNPRKILALTNCWFVGAQPEGCATQTPSSRRIELRAADHFFTDAAGFAERSGELRVIVFRALPQQTVELLVKQIADEFWGVTNRRAPLIENFNFVRVLHALRNHQAVDAIRSEIFHVAIEETRALAVEHAIAIANDGANRGARSGQRAFADSGRKRAKIGMAATVRRALLKLIRGGELANGNFVLIGMSRPGAVHQRVGFVLLVFREGLQRASVQFSVLAAGEECGHAADREHAVFVANFRQEVAQILEKRDVVRNSVAIGKYPLGVLEIAVDQAGHVVPAAEIEPHDVVAKIPGKLFHLKSERMRFDQRHAFDGVRRQPPEAGNHLEKIAPPESLVGGFGLGNVNTKRMLERAEVRLISDHRDVEERSGQQFPGQNSGLM